MLTIGFSCVFRMLMCVSYSIAAVILKNDTMRAYPVNTNQSCRRRMLALGFGALGLFYFSQLSVYFLFPGFFVEENCVDVFLLLNLSVIPVLYYLLLMTIGNNIVLSGKPPLIIAIVCVFLVACYISGRLINQSWFHTLGGRCLAGVVWSVQICIQGYLIFKIERTLKTVAQLYRYIRVYIYIFVITEMVTFFLLFTPLHSSSLIILQCVIWAEHGALFFYILKKDPIANLYVYPYHQKSQYMFSEAVPAYAGIAGDPAFGDLYERLALFLELEKPYLRPGINVADVAAHLYTNKTYLSRLLNERLNQNFNQFVNSYRVKEAQRIVVEQGPVALEKLCKMVGFSSMATFTVAFRLNTGMTPGEWCKKHKRPH